MGTSLSGIATVGGEAIPHGSRTTSLATARELLHVTPTSTAGAHSDDISSEQQPQRSTFICLHCGHAMTIVQIIIRAQAIRAPP